MSSCRATNANRYDCRDCGAPAEIPCRLWCSEWSQDDRRVRIEALEAVARAAEEYARVTLPEQYNALLDALQALREARR